MKVYHIAMLMMAVLAALFFLTPIFRKREQQKTSNERKYFELLKISDSQQEELVEIAKLVYGNLELDTIKEKIIEDKKAMGL